jgi:hypothetical protein
MADAAADGDDLWFDAHGHRPKKAWKPEGLCHGDRRVPLPPATATTCATAARISPLAPQREARGARRRRAPVLGTGAERVVRRCCLQAPDFELPDLGAVHRPHQPQGVFATWASW